MHYYNENDPHAAQWLRNLIADKRLPHGDVDDRSIVDVQASDLTGYTQCHFFAGIGGWPLALRLAGWPDDRPVWTGSCPCQPFSVAGRRKGTGDDRHLWPQFQRIIADGKPPIVFGEQVASKDGRVWLAGVRADLEALGYAVGAADLCAAGVGAPHIRQRLYWVADGPGKQEGGEKSSHRLPSTFSAWSDAVFENRGCSCGLHGSVRRCPPGLRLVADGISKNVALLSGYGNAIVPQVAAEFIAAYTEAIAD